MNYTRYFVINLVIEGFYNWLPERKRVARLSYVILEEKGPIFNNGTNSYVYTGICFKETHIKKSLNIESVNRLISINRFSINFSRLVSNPLTDEDILSFVISRGYCSMVPISAKSKIYSYKYDKKRIAFK